MSEPLKQTKMSASPVQIKLTKTKQTAKTILVTGFVVQYSYKSIEDAAIGKKIQ